MRGLPDFGAPVTASVFGAFEQAPALVGVPDRLLLARDGDGVPLIRLERFRGDNPMQPPGSYGLVTVWLTLGWPDPIDGRAPGHVLPAAGELRMALTGAGPEAAGLPEAAVSFDGALTVPWGARVDPVTITLLIGALDDGSLPLTAAAALEVRGVAPRLDVAVAVDVPATRALLAGAAAPLTALTGELLTPSGAITVVRGAAAPEALAAVLAERLPSLLTSSPETDPAAEHHLELDLAVPTVVVRRFEVSQHLRAQLAGVTLDRARLVPEGVEVPELELGWHGVDVLANLPGQRVGVLAGGVSLLAAPHPPARHQAVSVAAEFADDGARQELTLRLAPGEPLAYVARPWLVVENADGVAELSGPELATDRQRLVLGPDAFGVRFASLHAEGQLLEHGRVQVVHRCDDWRRPPVELGTEAPDAVVILSAAGDDTFDLRLSDGTRALAWPTRPATSLTLSLADVPGWGANAVPVRNATADPIALELGDEAGTRSEELLLSAGATREFRYLAEDPYATGWRYRLRPVGDPGPWQGPFPHDHPLDLTGQP